MDILKKLITVLFVDESISVLFNSIKKNIFRGKNSNVRIGDTYSRIKVYGVVFTKDDPMSEVVFIYEGCTILDVFDLLYDNVNSRHIDFNAKKLTTVGNNGTESVSYDEEVTYPLENLEIYP